MSIELKLRKEEQMEKEIVGFIIFCAFVYIALNMLYMVGKVVYYFINKQKNK